jgi:hypothetical protein
MQRGMVASPCTNQGWQIRGFMAHIGWINSAWPPDFCFWLIFVPTSSTLILAILEAAHSARKGGIEKTLHRLRADFFIDKMTRIGH